MLHPSSHPVSKLHPIEREKMQLQEHIDKIKQIIFTNPNRHHMQDWLRDKKQGAIQSLDGPIGTGESFGGGHFESQ